MIRVTWLMTTGMTHSQTWHSHSKCDMTPSYMWHHSIICVTWLITAGTTHSQMWHVSPYVTWLIRTCDMTHFICVTWLITPGTTTETCDMSHSKCDMTPSYMWHHSIICAIWLITACTTDSQMWHVSLHMWHESFVHVTWLTSYVWHDSLPQARLAPLQLPFVGIPLGDFPHSSRACSCRGKLS